MTAEVRVEHRYPQVLTFLRQYGSDALVILDDLVTHADRKGTQLMVKASVRQIADRLSFLSKDTVHRRLRQLHRASVIRKAPTKRTSPFEAPTYVVNLKGTGVSVTSS